MRSAAEVTITTRKWAQQLLAPALAVLAASFAACTGEIEGGLEDSVDSPGLTPGSGAGTGTSPVARPSDDVPRGGTPPAPASCGAQRAPVLRAHLLSPSQYNHAVADLLRVEGDFSKSFGGGVVGPPDELGVELRATAAGEVARLASKTGAQWSPCDPVKAGDAVCGRQLVDALGLRAFRRPLVEAERTQLNALFSAGLKDGGFATGVDWLVTGVLQAPDFLYRFARVAPGEKPGQVVPLDDYDLASRLAFFLWDGPPDDKLLAAAAAKELGDANRSQTHLDRLLQDPRSLRGVQAFYKAWLGTHAFDEVARDGKGFTTEVVNSLRTSLLMTVTGVHTAATGNLDALFSGQAYPLNGPLRRFYGLSSATEDFAPVEMPNRRGLLTHPALTTLLARPDGTDPISRGLFVRKKLLCQELEPPAGMDIPALPAQKTGVTGRERLAQHTQNPICAGCHSLIDPPGFALEGFDQVGKVRTMEAGKPVDSSGVMKNAGELDGPFATGDELFRRLPGSQAVRSCFARRYLEHALERNVGEGEDDRCTVDSLSRGFAASGDLKSLAPAVVQSVSFRFRKTEGAAP